MHGPNAVADPARAGYTPRDPTVALEPGLPHRCHRSNACRRWTAPLRSPTGDRTRRGTHGRTSTDPYHWLRDPGYPDVTDEDVLAYLAGRERLPARLPRPEAGARRDPLRGVQGTHRRGRHVRRPYVRSGYEYSWAYGAGDEYRTHSRRLLPDGEPQVFLDEPALAAGHEYFVLEAAGRSARTTGVLAYSVDTTRRRTVHGSPGRPRERRERLDDTQRRSKAGPLTFTSDGRSTRSTWSSIPSVGSALSTDPSAPHRDGRRAGRHDPVRGSPTTVLPRLRQDQQPRVPGAITSDRPRSRRPGVLPADLSAGSRR